MPNNILQILVHIKKKLCRSIVNIITLKYIKNMKTHFALTTISFFLAISLPSCQQSSKSGFASELPIIDLEKEYPVKRIDIHEIADVEYIPLETTDESLLQTPNSWAVSEDTIVIFDVLQHSIFVFDGKGKHIRTIDRFGQGPEEYYTALHVEADFSKGEIYVNAHPKIVVYDFNGAYKRTIKYPSKITLPENIHHYDSDFLAIFNNSYWPTPEEKYAQKADLTPFYLINKQDGFLKEIDKRLQIKTPIHQAFKMVKGQNGYYSRLEGFNFPHILKNSNDLLLVNNGLDTLYSYKDNCLTPIILRTPSAHNMSVPKLIAPFAYTDDYFMFGIVPMDYEVGKKYYFDERMAPHYMLDRKSGEIYQIELYDSLLDSDFDVKDKRDAWNIFPHHNSINMHSKNQALGRYKTELLLEKLKEGKLKGKLQEIASQLKFDDNLVVAKFKFK